MLHQQIKGQKIRRRRDRSGQREPRWPNAHLEDEEVVQAEIQADGGETHEHRSPFLVDCVEGWRKHFDAGIGDQTQRIKLEGETGLQGVVRS